MKTCDAPFTTTVRSDGALSHVCERLGRDVLVAVAIDEVGRQRQADSPAFLVGAASVIGRWPAPINAVASAGAS